MGNNRRSCMGYSWGLHAAGLSGTCSSSSSSLGHRSLSGSAFSKSLWSVSQTFSGSISADASLQPLSVAKQCPCFNGQVPPCSGWCDAFLRAEFEPPSAGASGLRGSVRCADLRGRSSLSGWWSLNGRLWTKVCNRICSVHSSSESCDLTRCCTSGSCASVVSRPVSLVSSASPVLVGGVGGSRVGLGFFFTGWSGWCAFQFSSCFSSGDGWRCCTWQHQFVVGHGSCMCPTGSLCSKYGVSGLAEDLRPVSEVEAGVNFRPSGVRGQVAGSLPRRQPGTGTRQGKRGVVTPSLHPVTWIRIGHQAIDGLDEGVWNRTIGDLGAKG